MFDTSPNTGLWGVAEVVFLQCGVGGRHAIIEALEEGLVVAAGGLGVDALLKRTTEGWPIVVSSSLGNIASRCPRSAWPYCPGRTTPDTQVASVLP